MANETIITVRGNLTADPELRHTQNGAAVANFTIASTPRVFDRATNEWKDADALFMRASVWREMAENVATSLKKGTPVVAVGELKQRSYQDRDGNNRVSIELDVHDIGPSLRYATAQVTRAQSNGNGGGGNQQGGNNAPAQQQSAPGWDVNQAAQQSQGFGGQAAAAAAQSVSDDIF